VNALRAAAALPNACDGAPPTPTVTPTPTAGTPSAETVAACDGDCHLARQICNPDDFDAFPAPPPGEENEPRQRVMPHKPVKVAVVLAARRHPESGALVWTIPKGHLEPGESSKAAAMREVREETGLEAEIEQQLGDITYWFARRDAEGRARRVWKRVRFFLMRSRGGRFRDRDREMDAVRWFSLDEAERAAAFASERALVQRARALLAGG